jgi:hypothetical protein
MMARFPEKFGPFSVCCGASENAHGISLGGNYGDRDFLFFSTRRPLIDALLAAGIASRQIR